MALLVRQDNHTFFVVIDGIGGDIGGRIAGKIIAKHLGEALNSGDSLFEALNNASEPLEDEFELTTQHGGGDRFENMGATVLVLEIADGILNVANSGDCKAVGVHAGQIEFETREHNEAQELLEQGKISRDQLLSHDSRATVTHCVTIANGEACEVEPEEGVYLSPDGRAVDFAQAIAARDYALKQGSIIGIATDGVWDCMLPEEFAEIVSRPGTLAEKVQMIRNRCREVFCERRDAHLAAGGDPDEIEEFDDNFALLLLEVKV